MDRPPTTTTRTRPRGRAVRAAAVAGAGALMVSALPGVASATGGHTWHVHPGQSIQHVVDKAASGDTIRLAAGTWTEAVCVEGKGLTIRGAGKNHTIVRWDRGATPASGTACWQATDDADAEDELEEDPANPLGDNVSGFFFLHPDSPVTVRDLQTQDHTANGIAAWGADGFTVTHTKGVGHDRYGIIAGTSRNIHIVGNVEEGVDRAAGLVDEDGVPLPPDAGTAGISIGDSADSHAFIAGNRVSGYNLGVFLRESSGGRVNANHLSGNCVGILAFDDAQTEIPGAPANVEGGDWGIRSNVSTANNRFCIQGREGDQFISGVGIAVVNAANVQVHGNTIRDNAPQPPEGVQLTFPSAGLVLLTFEPPPGTDPNPDDGAPGPVTDISVAGNPFGDNRGFVFGPTGPVLSQLDIFVGRATPGVPFIGDPGPLSIRGNRCDASVPAEYCGAPVPV